MFVVVRQRSCEISAGVFKLHMWYIRNNETSSKNQGSTVISIPLNLRKNGSLREPGKGGVLENENTVS